ncbi:hypothetical protein G6F42_027899 [Rhizopus arrhizus]|nr:hypothetical protein G6F42_027899 [Rhizopus arrhizus]
MHLSCFDEAITNFRRLDSDSSNVEPYKSTMKQLAFTPLEKLAVVRSTLDLITSTVRDYVQDFGNGISGEFSISYTSYSFYLHSSV